MVANHESTTTKEKTEMFKSEGTRQQEAIEFVKDSFVDLRGAEDELVKICWKCTERHPQPIKRSESCEKCGCSFHDFAKAGENVRPAADRARDFAESQRRVAKITQKMSRVIVADVRREMRTELRVTAAAATTRRSAKAAGCRSARSSLRSGRRPVRRVTRVATVGSRGDPDPAEPPAARAAHVASSLFTRAPKGAWSR